MPLLWEGENGSECPMYPVEGFSSFLVEEHKYIKQATVQLSLQCVMQYVVWYDSLEPKIGAL